jgi:hypothetical protein
MEEYRKLEIDLPRQPVSKQRWWLVAGWLLAMIILFLTAYAYLEHRKLPVSLEQQKEINFRSK